MTAEKLIERLDLVVTEQQRSAILELESRGLMFCGHFGIDNAIDTLRDMNEAFTSGTLYDFMKTRFGIV